MFYQSIHYNMKRLGIIGMIVIVLLSIGIFAGIQMYHKPHKDIARAEPTVSLTSEALFAEYSSNEEAANENYLNKIIQVEGKVFDITSTENGGYVLILKGDEMFGVNCAFQPEEAQTLSSIKEGDEVVVKGICTGMLMDVSLSRCTLVNQ